jgi:putative FmdB family regulatory protein
MPRYSYICTSCENHIEVSHSIDERLSFCDVCKTDNLKKILSIPNISNSNQINPLTNRKNGDIVNEKIKEFKESLKEQKQEMLGKKL